MKKEESIKQHQKNRDDFFRVQKEYQRLSSLLAGGTLQIDEEDRLKLAEEYEQYKTHPLVNTRGDLLNAIKDVFSE